MGYFDCIFLIWPTSCEKPNDGPVNANVNRRLVGEILNIANKGTYLVKNWPKHANVIYDRPTRQKTN